MVRILNPLVQRAEQARPLVDHTDIRIVATNILVGEAGCDIRIAITTHLGHSIIVIHVTDLLAFLHCTVGTVGDRSNIG